MSIYITTLTYLIKKCGVKNQVLLDIIKEVLKYLLKHKIIITAEYLPRSTNTEAAKEFAQIIHSAKQKLSLAIFEQMCQS